ncbi:MAG: hypothetical protein Tp1137MES00d2C23059491_71 [Prokaryotic dsDNA virus sp.]|nr:MAG: hypothetical protein Tp1137MES00d2C23059491_71 [Prokaryotic dsDNA virus sp.]|tara:strand:- start:33422 stop:33841 length:420 start_codon:yes stop_codon:yes gene_type:complete
MSDDIVTPLHLQTIEKYMAHQSEMQQKNADDMRETMKQTQISLQQLASSVNELVMAEKVREEKDQKTQELIGANRVHSQEQIDNIKETLKANEDGIRWSTKMQKWIDNYIMKVAVPFVFTALIIIIIANTFDFSKLAGK